MIVTQKRPVRHPKKLREEAALLCSAAASCETHGGDGNWQWNGPAWMSRDHWMVHEVDVTPEAADLAEAVHDHVRDVTSIGDVTWKRLRLQWAEAHALLMTGWTP